MFNTIAIVPKDLYLQTVRESCTSNGVSKIFDEVITGFRVAPGGAQARLGVTPDLTAFGKAIANGFPVACLAGRRELMELIGGPGHVIQAGTYNGQPVGMAATVATLSALQDGDVHAKLEIAGRGLMDGLSTLMEQYGIDGCVQGWPQVFHVAFGPTEITNYHQALLADRVRYVDFTVLLLQRGVRALERGAWFLSSAHDEQVIEETLEAAASAFAELASA
jgi:glutamate-1-semialdehyde 2,1-aminomutase